VDVGLMALCVALGLAVAAGSTRPIATLLAQPLVRTDRVDRVDAVAVLGYGSHADGTLSPATAYSLLHGVQLLQRTDARVLILSGGSHRGGGMTDAEAMAGTARALGIPLEALVLARGPSSTLDHARAVAALVRQRTLGPVAVVTPPLRSQRAVLAFRRAGVSAVAAPGLSPDEVDPTLFVGRDDPLGRLAVTIEVMAEYVALGVYRLRGWI
jgi:uncharacterized SAM-binding protein YcdF (DUF218 family)